MEFQTKEHNSDIIFLGTGSSTSVPWFRCLLDCKINENVDTETKRNLESDFGNVQSINYSDEVEEKRKQKSEKLRYSKVLCEVCSESFKNKLSKNRRRNPSILIKYKNNNLSQEKLQGDYTYILIDCGKTFRDAVESFFYNHGVKGIDAVILTHGHADAILGIDDLRDVQRYKFTYNEVTGKQENISFKAISMFCCDKTIFRCYNTYPYLFSDSSKRCFDNLYTYISNQNKFFEEHNCINNNKDKENVCKNNRKIREGTERLEEGKEVRTQDKSKNEKSDLLSTFLSDNLDFGDADKVDYTTVNQNTEVRDNNFPMMSSKVAKTTNVLLNDNDITLEDAPLLSNMKSAAVELFSENPNHLLNSFPQPTADIFSTQVNFGPYSPSFKSSIKLENKNTKKSYRDTETPGKIPQHMFVANLDWNVFSPFKHFYIGDLSILPLPVFHGDNYTAFAFEIGYSHDRVIYMSDVSEIPPSTLSYLQQGPQIYLLIVDALFIEKTHPTHFNLEQAIEAARILRPKKTVLTGMCHEFNYYIHNDKLKKLSEQENLSIEMGFDGLVMPVFL